MYVELETSFEPIDLIPEKLLDEIKPSSALLIRLEVNLDRVGKRLPNGQVYGNNELLNTLVHELTAHGVQRLAVASKIKSGTKGAEMRRYLIGRARGGGALDTPHQHRSCRRR